MYENLLSELDSLRQQTARFRRVTLHLHSPDSKKDWARSGDKERNRREQFYAEGGVNLFLNELRPHFDMVGVTDHMKCDYLPILKALVELGGSAKMQAVLDKVHKAMKPVLKDVDHEPLASDPEMPRWRNSAQWARNTMRQEGLLKDDSPHGTWEITEAGRARLAEGKPA